MATASPNILVVEDDRETRSLIAKYLRTNACNVTTANDGREMVRAMADHRVDLLILDVMLPGEDGLSLCRKVRAESRTRFTKGQSGNAGGRPRGRRREAPYEAVLGQMVTIREAGVERRVAAAEAFLLQLTKRGLEGDGAAARATLAVIEEVTERSSTHQGLPNVIVRTSVAPGSVTSALTPLRMAKKLDPYRETARMALEPWLVEVALARLDRRPSQGQVAQLVERTPVSFDQKRTNPVRPHSSLGYRPFLHDRHISAASSFQIGVSRGRRTASRGCWLASRRDGT
jgi:CheY-like chemotaxis protein